MKILTRFNFFFRNYFNDAASNLQWVHERYNWCVNLRNVGFFNGSCVSTHIVRVQGNSSIRIWHDQICTMHATSSLLWGRRETCTLTRCGSFRVFANQESRKRIGYRQLWTIIRNACIARRCDGRSQCRARKSAIAQFAVAQFDRDKYCLSVCHIPKPLSPAI